MPSAVEAKLRQVVSRWVSWAYTVVTNEIKLNLSGRVLKVDTGRLRSSIDINSRVRPTGFTVGTNVKYGIAWEFGFRVPARTIVPVKRKALKFMIGGRTLFRKKVEQPTRNVAARPFIRPAVENNLEKINGELQRRLKANMFDILVGGR